MFRYGVRNKSIRFLYNSDEGNAKDYSVLNSANTPAMLGMEDDDIIDVVAVR